MEMLSDRIGITKGEEDLTVYIKASTLKDAQKLRVFKIWVILWTIAGIVIASQLFFNFYTSKEKLYIAIYLAFWAFFEYQAVKAYYFRKYGIETIYINNDKIMLRRDILNKKGAPKYFKVKEKNPFHKVEYSEKSFANQYYKSFYVVTGGTVELGNMRFGLQLPEKDTHKLVKLMNSFVRTVPTNAG